jgi:hypothetical protein
LTGKHGFAILTWVTHFGHDGEKAWSSKLELVKVALKQKAFRDCGKLESR